MKHHSTFIFGKKNYLIMGIGLAVIAIGFILMSGGGSDNPAVFTAIWQSKDANGNEIPYPTEPFSSSESFASNMRYSGSLNGQFFFKIADE